MGTGQPPVGVASAQPRQARGRVGRWIAWTAVFAIALAAASAATAALLTWRVAPMVLALAPLVALAALTYRAGVDLRSRGWVLLPGSVLFVLMWQIFSGGEWEVPVADLASYGVVVLPGVVVATAAGAARGDGRTGRPDWSRWANAIAAAFVPWAWLLAAELLGRDAEIDGWWLTLAVLTLVCGGLLTRSWWWVAVAALPPYGYGLYLAAVATRFDDASAAEQFRWIVFLGPVPVFPALVGVALAKVLRRLSAGRHARRGSGSPPSPIITGSGRTP